MNRSAMRCFAAAAAAWIVCGALVAVGQGRSPEELVSQGDSPDAVLMYTGDVIGYLEPCG
jgi:hypothetical protein